MSLFSKVVHSLAGVCLVGVAGLGAAACDAETQAPRGAAYPDVVGYDTPEQAPTSGGTTPSQALEQQQRLAAQQQQGGAVTDWSDNGGGAETAIGNDTEGYADTDPSALTDFRSALDPYGSWAEDPTYGTVWTPSPSVVGDDFSPYYTGGHWAYGDDYVWVSDYDWGWAPFHYGRWAYMGGRGGWGWIPGRQYAGAWVTWRAGNDGYVGWGAMPPTWGWRGGTAVGIGVVPPAAYTFCNTHDLFAPSLVGHGVVGPQVASIAAHTQPYVPANPGTHVLANPGVAGPPPTTMLHIPASEVAHLPMGDRGLMRAQQFAHPGGAQLAGAHAPASFGGGGQRYAGNYGNYARGGFPGGAVAGHALLPRGGSMMPAYGRAAGRIGPTRIGGGYGGYGGNGAAAYSYGPRGGASYGSSFRGGSSYSSFRGGSSFGGSSFHGTAGAPASGGHSFGGYGGGFSGGGRGGGGGHSGGHGGGGHR